MFCFAFVASALIACPLLAFYPVVFAFLRTTHGPLVNTTFNLVTSVSSQITRFLYAARFRRIGDAAEYFGLSLVVQAQPFVSLYVLYFAPPPRG